MGTSIALVPPLRLVIFKLFALHPPVHSRIVLSFISFQTDKFRPCLPLSISPTSNTFISPFQACSIRSFVSLFFALLLFTSPFSEAFSSFRLARRKSTHKRYLASFVCFHLYAFVRYPISSFLLFIPVFLATKNRVQIPQHPALFLLRFALSLAS